MAITVEKQFEVKQPPEIVWDFLVTPERVVQCLPGGRLVRAVDDRTYEGEVGMRLGPIAVTFRGTIHFETLDRENFEVEMSGEGRDARGAGSVRMQMRSVLTALEDGGTRIAVTQTIHLAGKLASFGRGGIIQNVADFMFGRFTSCVTAKLAAGE